MSNKLGPQNEALPSEARSSGELNKLIRKLRWIGLEDQARSLELVERTLSSGYAQSPRRDVGARMLACEQDSRVP